MLTSHQRVLAASLVGRLGLSPHEWTWTESETELMARAFSELLLSQKKGSKLLDKETYDLLKWLAQTVHQGYHDEQKGTYETCPKSVCCAVKDFLKARSVENLVAESLMEDE